MPLDHLGVNVPDISRARKYYDALMPLVGFTTWFEGEDWVSYGPVSGGGTQLFLYTAPEGKAPYSREAPGLQHLCFSVDSRGEVDAAHAWAEGGPGAVVHEPRIFPEYHPDHYATFWLDPHGFTLEVVSFERVE